MTQLTDRRLEILLYIVGYIGSHGYAPSLREICTEIDLSSTSEAHRYLNSLEGMGYIVRTPNIPRSIVVDMDKAHESIREMTAL